MTTPPADAIARILTDQERELRDLRSALAQQTERAERAEWGLREAMARADRAERAEHRQETTLDRMRELRDEATGHAIDYAKYGDDGAADAYGWTRDFLTRALDHDQEDRA